jgi:aromatic-L-amino-acid/L-tryptophan decarboxylase
MSEDPLALDPEAMRRLGYRTVDMLVDQLADTTAPVLRRATPEAMLDRLGGPPPEEPEDIERILSRLEEDVLPFRSRVDHPGFFAFVPSSGTWPGALGDLIASACNVYAGSWMESAGPSTLELALLGWFKEWVGLPAASAGALTTGGSAANIAALACAREAHGAGMHGGLVAYLSDQAHSSLARAARLLGFRPDQVRVLPSDQATFRLEPATLAAAMEADRAAGRTPLFVAASAGATNTGAVDPLPELAALCRERGVWLHADAAYGGFAVLTERGTEQLRGLELADSIALDPHKWLYQSYECGCLLVREAEALRRAFAICPDYLRDAEAERAEVNFSDLGLQLTRAARAFKLWMSLRFFGLDAFRSAIDRTLDLAALARRRIEESPVLEPMAPPALGVVCFRRSFEERLDPHEVDRRNARLVAALEREGFALVSSTRLGGRYAIRMCILNHSTTAEDVERTLSFLETAAVEREAPSAARNGGDPWPLRHGLGYGAERRVAAGEAIVVEWDQSRDFFLILDGSVEVELAGGEQRTLRKGDFFGELGALDWGAGYHYSRTATVRARVPTRLLVLSAAELSRMMQELPAVDARVRAVAGRRLAELGAAGS